MKDKILKSLIKWAKIETLGVAKESNMRPEFVITRHAEQRLKERVGVSSEKMAELTLKAWYSDTVPVPHLSEKMELTINRSHYYHQENRIARAMMGKIYVFAWGKTRYPLPKQKVLITVI